MDEAIFHLQGISLRVPFCSPVCSNATHSICCSKHKDLLVGNRDTSWCYTSVETFLIMMFLINVNSSFADKLAHIPLQLDRQTAYRREMPCLQSRHLGITSRTSCPPLSLQRRSHEEDIPTFRPCHSWNQLLHFKMCIHTIKSFPDWSTILVLGSCTPDSGVLQTTVLSTSVIRFQFCSTGVCWLGLQSTVVLEYCSAPSCENRCFRTQRSDQVFLTESSWSNIGQWTDELLPSGQLRVTTFDV